MKSAKKKGLVLIILLIVMVGAGLRLYQLTEVVPILNRDEAALAYNAWLLSQVGVDEWNEPVGLTLRSFGDYKLIGYPILLVGLFKVVIPSDFWVRLPSALAGIGIIAISYPMARVFKLSKVISLLFTLVIAVSPFAVFYSRFAYEANLALFYVLLAFWLLLKTQLVWKLRMGLDILAISLLVIACFTYNSPLIVFLPILLIVAITRLKDGWLSWLPMLVVGSIAWLGVVWAIYPVISQKSGISLMTDPLVASQYADFRHQLPIGLQPILGNQFVYWFQIALENSAQSFMPDFLCQNIFHPWHGIPSWGQLIWPVVMVGWLSLIWLIIKQLKELIFTFKKPSSFKTFLSHSDLTLLGLLIISLIPAIITVDAPHATRSLLFLYLFCLISVWGVEQLLVFVNQFIKKKQTRVFMHYLIPIAMVIIIIASTDRYFQDLFGRYRLEANKIFQAGVVDIIKQLPTDSQVAVLDPEGYEYIRWAWYARVEPKEFLSTVMHRPPSVAGLRYGERVDRFRFIDRESNKPATDVSLVQWNQIKSSWEVAP